jgi:hypothetical protein
MRYFTHEGWIMGFPIAMAIIALVIGIARGCWSTSDTTGWGRIANPEGRGAATFLCTRYGWAVGEIRDCNDLGVCDNERLQIGLCQARYAGEEHRLRRTREIWVRPLRYEDD